MSVEEIEKEISDIKQVLPLMKNGKYKNDRVNRLKRLYRKLRLAKRNA